MKQLKGCTFSLQKVNIAFLTDLSPIVAWICSLLTLRFTALNHTVEIWLMWLWLLKMPKQNLLILFLIWTRLLWQTHSACSPLCLCNIYLIPSSDSFTCTFHRFNIHPFNFNSFDLSQCTAIIISVIIVCLLTSVHIEYCFVKLQSIYIAYLSSIIHVDVVI